MNLSNISTYDNIPSQDSLEVSEDITFVTNDILQILNISDPVIFCPFCVSSFSKGLELEKHLRKIHYAFVSELLYRSVAFIVCPFCPAKYCSVNLAAKHSIAHHARLIFDTFFANSHNGVMCQFCDKIFSSKNLANHINDVHLLQFNEWFAKKFSLQHGGMAGLVEIPTATADASKITCVDEDDLNKQLQKLNLLVPSSDCSKKSILKTTDGVKRKRKLPVRRELRFCNVDKENQSNITVCPRKNSAGSSINEATVLQKCNFQCGKCTLSFQFHSQLVHHVKTQHKKLSLNLLHPFYQCALCGAKFFKNSYLKKHSALHQIKRLR